MSSRFSHPFTPTPATPSQTIQKGQQQDPMSSYAPMSPREPPPHRSCTCNSTCVRNVENQLISGLGVLIDYLNKGNGEPELSRLRRRAELWCETYFGSLDYAISQPQPQLEEAASAAHHMTAGVPQSVLDAHPRIFDVSIRSQARLNPPPPPPPPPAPRSTPSLVSDNGTDLESDLDPAAAAAAGTRLEEQQRQQSHLCHQFPPYTEPVLLPDAAIEELLDRYDRDTALHEAARQQHLLTTLYEQAGTVAVGASVTPAHSVALLLDRRVLRAADLRGSPLLHHMPELLACLARLPPAPTFTQFLRNKQRRVDEHNVTQKIRQEEALRSRPRSDSNYDNTPPCPLAGLVGSVRMPRLGVAEMARREKNAETEDKDVFMRWSMDCAKDPNFNQRSSKKRRRCSSCSSSSSSDDDDDSDWETDSNGSEVVYAPPRAMRRLVRGYRVF